MVTKSRFNVCALDISFSLAVAIAGAADSVVQSIIRQPINLRAHTNARRGRRRDEPQARRGWGSEEKKEREEIIIGHVSKGAACYSSCYCYCAQAGYAKVRASERSWLLWLQRPPTPPHFRYTLGSLYISLSHALSLQFHLFLSGAHSFHTRISTHAALSLGYLRAVLCVFRSVRFARASKKNGAERFYIIGKTRSPYLLRSMCCALQPSSNAVLLG